MTSLVTLVSQGQIDHWAESARNSQPPTQWWDRSRFLRGGEANLDTCPELLDLTGRACFLFYGPYVPLSAGLWRATILLTLCTDAARRPIALQFGAEPDYATIDLPFGVPGDHRIVLEHRLDGGQPAQIRLWLKKAAFHGAIRFLGACVELVDGGTAEVPAARLGDHV